MPHFVRAAWKFDFNCYLFSDYTCDAQLLGSNVITGSEWSDESCGLIHGPVTGVRIWTSAPGYVKLWVSATYFIAPRCGETLLAFLNTASLCSRTIGIWHQASTVPGSTVVQSKRVYALVGSVNHLEWMEWHYNSWSQSNRRGSPWCFKAILYLVSFYQQLQIRFCLNPLTCMQQRGSLHSMRWSLITSGGKVKSSCIKFLWNVCNQVIKFLVHYIHIKPN